MYRLKDVMNMFDVPERTIRRHISNGLLKGRKIGGSWRFTEEDIHRYFASSKGNKLVSNSFTNRVSEYFNGFMQEKKDVLVSVNVRRLDEEEMQKLMTVLKEVSHKYKFHAKKLSDHHNISFIGHIDDAGNLLKFLEEYQK